VGSVRRKKLMLVHARRGMACRLEQKKIRGLTQSVCTRCGEQGRGRKACAGSKKASGGGRYCIELKKEIRRQEQGGAAKRMRKETSFLNR